MSYRRIAFGLFVGLLSVAAHAMLHLELTQGASKRIPIAWQDFIVMPGTKEEVAFAGALSSVLQSDLQNSGEFWWQGRRAFEGQLDYWLQGHVEKTASGGIVHIKLWQVLDAHSVTEVEADKPFWQGDMKYHDGDNLRSLGHRLSDQVYEAITGHKGIFSAHIAYVLVKHHGGSNEYALHIADADGQNPQEILHSPEPIMSPAWSSNGKQLAYVSFESLHPGVYVQDLISGDRRLVAQFNGINGAPAFSPSGEQLALVLSKDGSPNLFILNLKDGALKQVTHGWSLDTEPYWHPTGNALLFTSNRGGSPQIYEYRLASGKVKRLSYEGGYNVHPSMDQTGRFLIYLHKSDRGFAIARQPYPSGKVRELMAIGQNQSPSLSPNGRVVLYTALYHGKRTLFMVSVNGAVRMRLPAPEGEVQSPAWSPYF